MAFERITEDDLQGKGNLGRPDTPGVDTTEMQRILDELPREVIVPAFNRLAEQLEAAERRRQPGGAASRGPAGGHPRHGAGGAGGDAGRGGGTRRPHRQPPRGHRGPDRGLHQGGDRGGHRPAGGGDRRGRHGSGGVRPGQECCRHRPGGGRRGAQEKSVYAANGEEARWTGPLRHRPLRRGRDGCRPTPTPEAARCTTLRAAGPTAGR